MDREAFAPLSYWGLARDALKANLEMKIIDL
jgi:hypothetical protein